MITKTSSVKQNGFIKYIIPVLLSLVILLTTLFVWISGIYGWFAMNRTVAANGMSVEVKGNPYLIISNSSSDIQNLGSSVGHWSLSFPADTNTYRPSKSTFGDLSTYSTGLYTVTNVGDVDIVSGLKKEELENLSYETANNTNDTLYYRDITVYVASEYDALNDYSLSASISRAFANGTPITSGTLMSLSIDFYVNSISSSNYKGTLNVAGQEANDPLNECEDLTSITLVDSGIPLNTTGYITIIMRVYLDGALVDKTNTSKAYINTASLDLSRTSVDIRFTASENE